MTFADAYAWITHADKMPFLLIMALGIFFTMLYKAQVGQNTFDLKQVIIDPDTKMVSLSRIAELLSLIVTSWAFVHLVLNNNLTETFFTIYMTVWSGSGLASKGIAAYKAKKLEKPIEIDPKS